MSVVNYMKLRGALRSVLRCALCVGVLGISHSAYAAVASSISPVLRLSLEQDGIRQSTGTETLTYSSQWDGGEGATVTIAQDGVAIAEGLTGEDTYDWSVSRNGTYVLTHTTYTNGVSGKVETATFVVTGRNDVFEDSDIIVTSYSNKYDGISHGIGIVIVDEIADATLRYASGPLGATSPTSVWSDEAPLIINVGSLTVWCEVSAPGYITQTNSATVTILPREVSLVSGSASKVYDGAALVEGNVVVEGDGFVAGEGAVYNVIGSQTVVGLSENTFNYTLNDNTKAGNYLITTSYGTLVVTAASIGGGISSGGGLGSNDEPGTGSVPSGGVSKFDRVFEYDGNGHTIDAAALLAAYEAAVIGGAAECKYALSEASATWQDTPPVFTNVCTTSIWYKVSAANYEDFVHEVRLTINPRDIANVTIDPIADVTFDNNPVMPTPVVADGDPSIITADDYTVSYLNNTVPGTATLTLTGKGNYTGEKVVNFTIKEASVSYAALKGELAWKLNMGSGCYTAQLILTCTNGFNQGISDLKFIYQDRMNGTKITSGLWNSSARAYRATTTINGTTYRYVSLDASKITAQDVATLYGVQDVSVAVGVVPVAQCTIELFVGNLASPLSDIGYIMWKSNGAQCMLPISAAGGSQGMAVSQAMIKTMRMASSASMLSSPMSTSALNTSLALGVALDPASSPYCKLADFSVTGSGLMGRVEVGKEANGVETKGALGANARVVLMGAKDLSEGFSEIGNVPVDENGVFEFHLGSKNYKFFKLRIDVENVVE